MNTHRKPADPAEPRSAELAALAWSDAPEWRDWTAPPRDVFVNLDTADHQKAVRLLRYSLAGKPGNKDELMGVSLLAEQGLACHRLRPNLKPPPAATPWPARLVGGFNDPKPPPPPPRPQLTTARDVTREDVAWLMPGRFPSGMVSLIAGNQGVGKSTFISWLISTVSSGGPWPYSAERAAPGHVIVLQAEEHLGSAYMPRLQNFQADLDKIHFLTAVRRDDDEIDRPFSISRDVDALEIACDTRGGEVSLVLIDPIGAYLTGISGNNEAEVREAVAPLFRFAERRKIAVVCVVHLNKNSERPVRDRVSGTFALPAMSRMVWYLSQDPTKKSRRMLSLIKGNLDGMKTSALAFGYRQGRLKWARQPMSMLAEDVDFQLHRLALDNLTGGEIARESTAAAATAFVLSYLTDEQRRPLSTVTNQAKALGFKISSLRKGIGQLRERGLVLQSKDDEGKVWLELPKAPPEPST